MAYSGAEKAGRRCGGPRRRRQAGLTGVAAAGPPAPGRMLAEPVRFGNGNDEMQGFPLLPRGMAREREDGWIGRGRSGDVRDDLRPGTAKVVFNGVEAVSQHSVRDEPDQSQREHDAP